MAWRQSLLQSYRKADGNSVFYAYNKDGLRTRRYEKASNNDILKNNREYIYDGSKLVAERWTDPSIANGIFYNYYIYDAAGMSGYVNIVYDKNKGHKEDLMSSASYILITDTFGTVHEIKNTINNQVVAKFDYDEWGKCTVVSNTGDVAKNFPFRWKGYYLDQLTGFYYIGGRWYDPDTGRFINAAAAESILVNAGVVGGANRYSFNLNDYTNAAGNRVSITSEYDLTPPLGKRHTFWERLWRTIGIVLMATLAIVGAIFTGFAAVGAICAGIAAIKAGSCLFVLGMTGIVVGSLTLLASVYTIADSVATICETFTLNGYNFMRDGLYRGNATLHRIMSMVSAAVMIIGSIASIAITRHISSRILNGNLCFAAGTLVLCKDTDGNECHKVIEDVKVGDLVWSYDEDSGTSDWKPVVQLFRNTTSSWICTEIEVDGKTETIKSTAEHPYYVLNAEADRQIVDFEGRDSENYNGQWVAAKDLKIGDKCLLSSGKTGIISKQEVEHLAEPETTYNFEVADFHTYYVGEQGILVHNDCVGYQHNGNDVYRGGDFKPDSVKGHYKVDANGNVLPSRGPSVNYNTADIPSRFAGNINKVTSMPDGLILTGGPTHFEVIPAQLMPKSEYLKLLGQIGLSATGL